MLNIPPFGETHQEDPVDKQAAKHKQLVPHVRLIFEDFIYFNCGSFRDSSLTKEDVHRLQFFVRAATNGKDTSFTLEYNFS